MKQVLALGGLLAVSLVGSYLTWTSEDTDSDDDAVLVYAAAAADLQGISWKSEKLDVRIEKRTDDRGEYLWVHTTERKEVAKPVDLPEAHDHAEHDDHGDEEEEPAEAGDEQAPEDGTEPEPEPEPEIEVVETQFLGNEAAGKMWDAFAPLHALRALQPPSDFDRTVFGFDEAPAELEVTRRSGVVSLKVGGETYGSRDRYVQQGQQVFLVDDATLRPLQYATTRLVERRLYPLAEKDTEQVVVRLGAQSATFVHQNADDRAQAFWAAEAEPEVEHDVAGTWLGKVFKLRLRGYTEEAKLSGPLSPVFGVDLVGDGETWSLEILKGPGEGTADEYYARTSFNRSLVHLTRSLADDAAGDVGSLFE